MFCKFYVHIMKTFFQKYFQVAPTPLYPRILTSYPIPVLGGTPGFLHQNDRKGCETDYLDALAHFVLRFGAVSDKPTNIIISTSVLK